MSDWAAIEQALKRWRPTDRFDRVEVYAKEAALAAVGEAKRRESELERNEATLHETYHRMLTEAEARVSELERALPNPERLEEIARLLDLFDRVAELADDLLPGEKENYRAIDHTQMQDDLRAWAERARKALGVRGEAQPPVYGFSDTTNEARREATGE